MSYIYLASPYSSSEPFVQEERYLKACRAVHYLLQKGVWVFSLIVHCYELAKMVNLPKDAAFWQNYNFAMLAGASKLIILRIEGWEASIGVRAERAEADRLKIPFEYL